MPSIQENFSLKKLNTFGIAASSKYFAACHSEDDLQEILSYNKVDLKDILILGGGSNTLFTKNYNGLIIHNKLKGVSVINETSEKYFVEVAAGENWHEFVMHCVNNGFAGIENLALIPGNVGASPMQNIGAYGVEIQQVFHSLKAYHLFDKKIFTLSEKDCAFGYRESIFKKSLKGKCIILSVIFALNKVPNLHTSYGAIEEELKKLHITNPTIKQVAEAVIKIRESKLPNPAVIGNAGSFFKNPIIPKTQFNLLQLQYPNIIGYETTDHKIKVAAGWLIETCGWKGYSAGNVGCHSKQALVLVNNGNATGAEVYELSSKIIDSVSSKFGIILEREVNII